MHSDPSACAVMNPLDSDCGPVSSLMPRASKREAGFVAAIFFLFPLGSMAQGTWESEMFIHISLLHKNLVCHSASKAQNSPGTQQVLIIIFFTDCRHFIMTLGKFLHIFDS